MHPWVWLNEPQHSSAIQSVVAVLFGLPTLAFLVVGTIAARSQVRAANAQAAVAKAQTRLLELQLHEQVRPVLVLERQLADEPWDSPGQIFLIRNVGSGAANKIGYEWTFLQADGRKKEVEKTAGKSRFVLPPSQSRFLVRPDDLWEEGARLQCIVVIYTDVRGGRYHTTFVFNQAKYVEMVTYHSELPAGN